MVYVRPRVEQPGKYRKIAARVHRLKVGQHFDVPGIGIDERSRNRFRSGVYTAGQGLGARAAGRLPACHESRSMLGIVMQFASLTFWFGSRRSQPSCASVPGTSGGPSLRVLSF